MNFFPLVKSALSRILNTTIENVILGSNTAGLYDFSLKFEEVLTIVFAVSFATLEEQSGNFSTIYLLTVDDRY